MTAKLPALPNRRALPDVASAEALEARLTAALPGVDNVEVLEEWRAQAAALAEYLRGRELQGPMLGAQRRVEARIGQLLGEPERGGRGQTQTYAFDFPRPNDRSDFRLLARALNGGLSLTEEEWRQSRAGLVALIKERLPDPPRSSIASRDVKARLKLRREFGGRLKELSATARWVENHVERRAALAPDSEIDRWLVSLEETQERLVRVHDSLLNREVVHGGGRVR